MVFHPRVCSLLGVSFEEIPEMYEVSHLGHVFQLLPEKAIYIESLQSLLIADVHLGKSETFQALGVPIPNQVNQQTLERLRSLCAKFNPKTLIILGDLFHSRRGLVDEVLEGWSKFCQETSSHIQLIVGNHDRHLISMLKHCEIECHSTPVQVQNLLLSHEPSPQATSLNICGHVHPCFRIRSKLDTLRLPCFYFDSMQRTLTLPSFGEFTGGHEVSLEPGAIAYVIADNAVIPFGSR